MNKSTKESSDFLGIQWEPWGAGNFWHEFITMGSTTIVIFGGYLIAKGLVTGKWKTKLDNWFEFVFLMSMVVSTSRRMKEIYFP